MIDASHNRILALKRRSWFQLPHARYQGHSLPKGGNQQRSRPKALGVSALEETQEPRKPSDVRRDPAPFIPGALVGAWNCATNCHSSAVLQ